MHNTLTSNTNYSKEKNINDYYISHFYNRLNFHFKRLKFICL